MKNGLHRFCAYAGPIAATVSGVGLYFAGWLPPPDPGATASEVAAFYRANVVSINLCAISLFIMQAGALAQYVGIADQISMSQSPFARSWGKIVLATGVMAIIPPLLAGLCWLTAAYRPDRLPDVTQAFHDLGWFCFVDGGVCVAIVQFWCIGIATIKDETGIFPRWYSYFNFWNGLIGLSGLTVPFFKIGPFAWNGVISFWLPAILFGVFLNMNVIVMNRFDKRRSLELTNPSRN